MRIEGGCHCGFIKYEGDADPEKTAICHCTDCQTLSGSAFRTVVPVGERQFPNVRGRADDLYQDRGERKRAPAGVLPEMRLADLLGLDRSPARRST